ncbi:hypothetical protein GMMP15_360022 [Candidatus Magnetomoraceae bacterium gMMP-15]
MKNTLLYTVLLILFLVFNTKAAELLIPAQTGFSGESIKVPVIISYIDNMAGIKLVLEYDHKVLSFQNGKKTSVSSSLMHIINKKTPGKLIIVMAGARGISIIDNSPILHLFFMVNKNTGPLTTNINVKDIQIMSDNLKEVHCNIKTELIAIEPNNLIQKTNAIASIDLIPPAIPAGITLTAKPLDPNPTTKPLDLTPTTKPVDLTPTTKPLDLTPIR